MAKEDSERPGMQRRKAGDKEGVPGGAAGLGEQPPPLPPRKAMDRDPRGMVASQWGRAGCHLPGETSLQGRGPPRQGHSWWGSWEVRPRDQLCEEKGGSGDVGVPHRVAQTSRALAGG